MSQAQLIADVSTDVILAAFFSSVLFIAAYSIVAPWWRNQFGRSLVAMDAGIMLTLLPLALRFTLDISVTSSTFFAWFQIGAVALVALSTAWRTWIMLRVQWRERAPDDDHENSRDAT